jgi:hypothetical protein
MIRIIIKNLESLGLRKKDGAGENALFWFLGIFGLKSNIIGPKAPA